MKYAALALLLLMVGIGLMRLEPEHTEQLVPVVRVRTQDGLFITAVQNRTVRRDTCEAANERFSGPLSTCPTCTIESIECALQLEGFERALAGGDGLPVYTITAPGVRMAIIGPDDAVRTTCRDMALQIVQQGVKSAACISPQSVPSRL